MQHLNCICEFLLILYLPRAFLVFVLWFNFKYELSKQLNMNLSVALFLCLDSYIDHWLWHSKSCKAVRAGTTILVLSYPDKMIIFWSST